MINRFLWTGKRNFFTLDDVDKIVEINPRFLVLPQFADGGQVDTQIGSIAVAEFYRKYNIPVYIHFASTHNHFGANWFCAHMNRDWLLPIVKKNKSGNRDRHFYDWSNEKWIDRAVGIVHGWQSNDRVHGIALDGCRVLHSEMSCRIEGSTTTSKVGDVLKPEKIREVNAGFKEFLLRIKGRFPVIANMANGGSTRQHDNWNMELWPAIHHESWIHSEWAFIDPRTGKPRTREDIQEFVTKTQAIPNHAVTANVKSEVWKNMTPEDQQAAIDFAVNEFQKMPRHEKRLFNVGPYDQVTALPEATGV